MRYRWLISRPDEVTGHAYWRGRLVVRWNLSRCLLNRGFTIGRSGGVSGAAVGADGGSGAVAGHGGGGGSVGSGAGAVERVVLFGDYDVDGVTATAILREVMTALGWSGELLFAVPV
jgi:hypothetical protein